MKPKRSVEHVVTDLFAFLGTYDYRDERRILALDSKGPEAFETFYSSYLPLIITLWTQALQYNHPKFADSISNAFVDEVTARLYRLGGAKLAEDIRHGVAGLPKLLQRENGIVLVAAACVESLTGGNIPKKGKRANLLTQKILKILQFFITKLAAYEVVEISPVRAPYVSMFFANSNGDGTRPASSAQPRAVRRKTEQTAAPKAQPAAAAPAAQSAAPSPAMEQSPPEPRTPREPEPQPHPTEPASPEPVEAKPAPTQSARRELPPEPLTSDEPPLEEIEEVWAEKESVEQPAEAVASAPSETEAPEPAAPTEQEQPEPELELESDQATAVESPATTPSKPAPNDDDIMDELPEDMSASFYDDDEDDLLAMEEGEADDIVLDDEDWEAQPEEDEEDIGAGDPYNELGIDDAGGADTDFSGFEFEESGDDEKFDRGIDVDEFQDVINQVVTEVLASQEAEKDQGR